VMAINTACSSSLVAAHSACQSLRQGECDTAIAAGVNLMVSPEAYVGMSEAGMLSSDGKCYVFDKRANGMVPGEAVAVVVLKRLSRALADGDPVHAVIRGSGVNYDGRTNGITAPSGVSQTELMRDVYERCRLPVRDIDYIVTHGTGTQLGDPVEINALCDAFKSGSDRQGTCALTSTKSNFGHTFAASGLLSLISLVQAIRHKTIPASLHCIEENDYIRLRESPFYVNKQARAWTKEAGQPRIGAVSAFGISGTNAHVVVQEHITEPREPAPIGSAHLIVLSARTESALGDKIAQTAAFLATPRAREIGLADISRTLLHGRHHFEHRCALVATDLDEAMRLLDRGDYRSGAVDRDFVASVDIEGLARRSDRNALQELADLYCQGYEIPSFGVTRRVSLPGYPFARERYWIEDTIEVPQAEVSTLVYLKVARLAVEAAGHPMRALGNIVWGASNVANPVVTLHQSGDATAYSIARENDASICVHLGEVLTAIEGPKPGRIDFRRLRAGLKPTEVDAGQVTDVYGSASQVMATSENGAPLDTAWRLARSLLAGDLRPASLRRVEWLRPMPARVTIHVVRKDGVGKFDISFLDADEEVCVRLLDLTVAPREQLFDIPVQA
jgi:polyketide synthase PksN